MPHAWRTRENNVIPGAARAGTARVVVSCRTRALPMCGGCNFGDTSDSCSALGVPDAGSSSMIALGACLLILISTALRAADPPAAPAPAGRPETSAVELPRFQPRDVLIASDLTSYQDMSE